MAALVYWLLSLTAVLSAVQLIRCYSFNNCIEDPRPRGQTFKCFHRSDKNVSDFIRGLPSSAICLIISINPVTHIPHRSFVQLPNLQRLELSQNLLTTIDELAFQGLHHLKVLNLSFNHISALHPCLFKDLHNLTFLSLTNNKLTQLPEGIFSTLLKLDTLILQQNLLSDFSGIARSVSHLKSLTHLDLCFNSLTSLNHSDASLPKSLGDLHICRNNLSTLDCDHSFLEFVKVLDLSYNWKLPTRAFKGVSLRHLNYLRLQSTGVDILELLNTTDIYAAHLDLSGTGLRNDTLLKELCRLLKRDLKEIKILRLTENGIKTLTNHTLSHCPEITEAVDLSYNKLKNIGCLRFLDSHTRIKTVTAEFNLITSLPTCNELNRTFQNLELLSYSYNRILSVQSRAFYNTPYLKTLKLNINNIAYLNYYALEGLAALETLRLDNNLLTDLFKRTFKDLFKLKILNLRNNRISVIFDGTFLDLGNLTSLDLGGNKITHFSPAGLSGLKSLSKFYLDGNNLIMMDSSLYLAFQDTLTILDLRGNKLSFASEKMDYSPFMHLTKLADLKLDGQRPYGLTVLPHTLFRGLHSLKSLYLTNGIISFLHPDVFDDLTSLNFLTLNRCCVGLTQLHPGVFKNLRNLTKLTVENMGIDNFSKEVFGNLSQLNTLQLDRNVMQSINVNALESLPNLYYIDIRGNPLGCTCTNTLLQNWTLRNPNVQVVYLYNFPCPHDPKDKFYKFDTKVCYIDLGEYLFLNTALFIFLFTVTPLLYVKLYWKMKYGYYVLSAWFTDQWRKFREEEEKCKYDAFISYNSFDQKWVTEHLLPELEGNKSPLKLCLHHRDFEPGRYIVDNIVTAVYGSRKTICLVSRNFLKSEWCSLEIQLASYRLFDEHRDVLLLVFLEHISERELSSYHRMRKVMLKKTYLQWPGSDCTDPSQAQNLFWNKLRRAIGAGSRVETSETHTDEKDVTESKESENFETQTSDENYYLLP